MLVYVVKRVIEMRKIFILFLAIILLGIVPVSFAQSGNGVTQEDVGCVRINGYTYQFRSGMKRSDFHNSFGEPKSIKKEPKDMIWGGGHVSAVITEIYDGFEVSYLQCEGIYDKPGNTHVLDYPSGVKITGKGIYTMRGLQVGDSENELLHKYYGCLETTYLNNSSTPNCIRYDLNYTVSYVTFDVDKDSRQIKDYWLLSNP